MLGWPTFLFVAAELVAQPVALRRGRHHEGEAHEQRCILGQRPVSLHHVTGMIRKVGAAAGGVAQAHPLLSWRGGEGRGGVKIP